MELKLSTFYRLIILWTILMEVSNLIKMDNWSKKWAIWLIGGHAENNLDNFKYKSTTKLWRTILITSEKLSWPVGEQTNNNVNKLTYGGQTDNNADKLTY